MQSARVAASRVFQLLASVVALGVTAALIGKRGPFSHVPNILKYIMVCSIAGMLAALFGLVPALAATSIPAIIPVIFDFLMSLLFLVAAIVLSAKVGLKSCSIRKWKKITNSEGYSMQYPMTDRYWINTITLGQPGDGYLHTKDWKNRCNMNKLIAAALWLATIFLIASLVHNLMRYLKNKASPDGSVIDGPRYGPRQPKDDLVVVPEVSQVA